MAKGTKVTLSRHNTSLYFKRTEQELQALRDRDAAAGRFIDDGGEPILYGPYSGWSVVGEDCDTLEVTVTSLRPKGWLGWGRRPKGLVGGWCEKLNRPVLFRTV